MHFKSRFNYILLIPKIFLILLLLVLSIPFLFVCIRTFSFFLLCFYLIFCWVTYFMVKSLFTQTLWITLTDQGLEISFPLMGRREKYSWNQITEFYTSNEYNKQRSFAQIIVFIKGRKKLKISKESVTNYNEMIEVFRKSPIHYAGFKEQGLIDFEDINI